MTVLNSNLAAAWTPEDYGALVDRVVDATSVAFTAGTVIDTQLQSIRIPILAADPSTGWYAENTPITLTDPTTTEIEIKPTKVAGLTQASNEAVADSEPAVANQIGTSLARDISKKVDAAFFANTTTNGPPGLLSVSGVQVVDTGAVWANIDAVHDGKAAALAQGANLTHILLAPDVALQLAKTKVQTGSNQGLFDNVADGITLAGLTVLVSPAIPAGNAWAVDNSQVLIVRRTGTAVVVSTDAAFGSDAVQIRATSRVGFGFANPAGIVRLYDAA
ncbi:phage major capsid protein [Mycobacterium hodleri]|uniref:phage major capsid protein n=1 Tax=Mycolicibacterium hodleri TaxID=49897 RepID=UPI0021F36FBF|nr:phage major capsid protein [Mycolicibacterium hodleri]MCV7132520.1 phage major capsid protein [Mycolicibacterium hodleri]